MSFGLLAWDAAGREVLREDGSYIRLFDSFNPISVGVPSSKQYPLDENIEITVTQGGGRILDVTLDNNKVSWKYADSFTWPEYAGLAEIKVVSI